MKEKKNMNTTKDISKMALEPETVVCQREVKPLRAVEAVQNRLKEFRVLLGFLSAQAILHGLFADAFTHRRFYTKKLLHTEAFTHRRFYTQMLLHTDAFTHRSFYTKELVHTEAFTHRRFYTDTFKQSCFYTQTLLHTDAFTHRHVYTQTLLHKEAFTHRHFYRQTLLHTDAFTHRSFYTRTLLHTDACTHGSFCTQKLLHTDAFTHRRFYTQKLLHTEAFTHRHVYTQTRLNTNTFTHRSFYTQTRWHTDAFAGGRTSFRAEGLPPKLWNRNCTSVFSDRTSFRAKGLPPKSWNRQFTAVFGDRTSFRAKGLPRKLWNRNFTSVLAIELQVRFVRKGCVSCRLVGTAPRLQERNRKEGESKRAREQEDKRARGQERMLRCEDVRIWRWEDVKMRRCEDERMWRCEDLRMWRWEDVKMSRCEDVKMWGCEDEKMWRCEDVRMRRCEDVRMWRWEDVEMWGCEDEKIWRCENVWQTPTTVLEEPFAQTLSGKTWNNCKWRCSATELESFGLAQKISPTFLMLPSTSSISFLFLFVFTSSARSMWRKPYNYNGRQRLHRLLQRIRLPNAGRCFMLGYARFAGFSKSSKGEIWWGGGSWLNSSLRLAVPLTALFPIASIGSDGSGNPGGSDLSKTSVQLLWSSLLVCHPTSHKCLEYVSICCCALLTFDLDGRCWDDRSWKPWPQHMAAGSMAEGPSGFSVRNSFAEAEWSSPQALFTATHIQGAILNSERHQVGQLGLWSIGRNIFILEGGKVALIDCGQVNSCQPAEQNRTVGTDCQVAQLFREQRLLVAEAMLGEMTLQKLNIYWWIQDDTGTTWPLCAVQCCPWFGLLFSSRILRQRSLDVFVWNIQTIFLIKLAVSGHPPFSDKPKRVLLGNLSGVNIRRQPWYGWAAGPSPGRGLDLSCSIGMSYIDSVWTMIVCIYFRVPEYSESLLKKQSVNAWLFAVCLPRRQTAYANSVWHSLMVGGIVKGTFKV